MKPLLERLLLLAAVGVVLHCGDSPDIGGSASAAELLSAPQPSAALPSFAGPSAVGNVAPPASADVSSLASLPDVVGDPRKGWPQGYVPSRIRDRADVDFRGAKETWLLRWKSDPEPACFVEEARKSGKCLGIDGAAESGKLEIARIKDGIEIFSEDLTEVLSEKGPVVVARFPSDVRYSARGLARAEAKKLMVLGDYNQDGIAAEFVTQGPMRVWVARPGVLIGFSTKDGKLFAYKALDVATWEKVKTLSGTLEVITTPCFDHASPTEYVDVFTKTAAGVTRGRKQFTCVDRGNQPPRGAVQSSEPAEPLGF
jgi:hypothetical protein